MEYSEYNEAVHQRLQDSLWFSSEGGLVWCSHWVAYLHETATASKIMSRWNL